MSEKELDKYTLNPDIQKVSVGIKSLREVTIYPFSIPDQVEMTKIVTAALQMYFSTVRKAQEEKQDDIFLVAAIIRVITENVEEILKYATCGEEDPKILLKECTNNQLLKIVDVIFKMNFEDVIKNGKSLFEKIRILFLSERQSPSVADITPVTE